MIPALKLYLLNLVVHSKFKRLRQYEGEARSNSPFTLPDIARSAATRQFPRIFNTFS